MRNCQIFTPPLQLCLVRLPEVVCECFLRNELRIPRQAAPLRAVCRGVLLVKHSSFQLPERYDVSTQRDRHIATINTDGRMKWQAATGYGKRLPVETAIGRYKSIIGRRLWARSFRTAQQTEAALGCAVLNRMHACARPKSVRCKAATASKARVRQLFHPLANASQTSIIGSGYEIWLRLHAMMLGAGSPEVRNSLSSLHWQ